MLKNAAGQRRIALQGLPLAQQDDRHLPPARDKFGGRDEPVAAVVAAPGHHEDRSILGHIHRGIGHRMPGPQHQHKAGLPAGNREAIGLLHFGDSQNVHVASMLVRLILRQLPPLCPRSIRLKNGHIAH